MKKITKKKVIREAKAATKVVVKKTGVLIKRAEKGAGKMAKAFEKRWKKAEPEREKYKKEVKEAATKAGKRGVQLLKSGLKNSYRIGKDVAEVIKNDIKKIQEEK